MKKTAIIAIASFLTLSSAFSIVCAEKYTKFSNKFIKNFKDCDKYEETITSTFESNTFTTHRKIQGWFNGYCRYEEIIKSPKDEYQLICNIPSMQVDELYDAMKNKSRKAEKYELEIYAMRTDDKTGKSKPVVIGTSTINGNKTYIAWARIQNNPYFCSYKKLK